MKVACYYAAAEGAHPHCTPSEYDIIWPVMQRSVERHGYELIHLTGQDDPAKCDNVFRTIIRPETVMFSREIAWVDFLRSLDDGEEAVLIEPDAYLNKPIPPLTYGDMMLLHRPNKSLPSGFRLCTNKALPFYEAVVQNYRSYPYADKVFHGDVKVHHALLGLGKQGAVNIPRSCRGVRIEIRDWLDYTSKRWAKAVAWNFKGTSKTTMLQMAKGIMPELR